MRKLLSKTAGATFNEERPNLTLCVRKDCIEFIYKGNPGVYIIVNMIGASDDEIHHRGVKCCRETDRY